MWIADAMDAMVDLAALDPRADPTGGSAGFPPCGRVRRRWRKGKEGEERGRRCCVSCGKMI